jgi:hypothetical protein
VIDARGVGPEVTDCLGRSFYRHEGLPGGEFGGNVDGLDSGGQNDPTVGKELDVALIAPRTARLVGVDDSTLRVWAERGLMSMTPDEAAMMRVSAGEADEIQARMRDVGGIEDYGYVPHGPVEFADEEPRPFPR